MPDPSSMQTTMSIDELKQLIREAVRETLLEMLGEDMNSEPNFIPEIADRLRRYQQQKPATVSIDDVISELVYNAAS